MIGLIVVLVLPNLKQQTEQNVQKRLDDERAEVQRKADHERELESIRAIAVAAAPAAGSPSDSPASVAEELTKLAALRDQGVLTVDEFTVQKARVLARA